MITGQDLFGASGVVFLLRIGFVVFAALYFIFSLIIVRQVSLMAETVRTEFGGFLKIFSLLFALFSLAILIYFIIKL